MSLTKVKKKTKEWKEGIIALVHECVDKYERAYVFKYMNMRNARLKELRDELQDSSRFVMGSMKVLRVALGKSEAEEYQQNLHLLGEHLTGNAGVFFTNLPKEKVTKIFADFEDIDYARPGSKATQDFTVAEGEVQGPAGPFPHTLEPVLRSHGLPTKLDKGIIKAVSDYQVCKQGKKLSADQAALLRHFDVKMARFKMFLAAEWVKEDGEVTVIRTAEELEEEMELEDMGGEGDGDLLDELP